MVYCGAATEVEATGAGAAEVAAAAVVAAVVVVATSMHRLLLRPGGSEAMRTAGLTT